MALCVGLGLASCSKQQGFLEPVASTAPGASVVPVVIATTRKPAAEDSGYMFNGERALTLSYAQVDVSIPPTRTVGKIQWPKSPPGNPAHDFVTVSTARFDKAGFRTALRKQISARRESRVLLFIHGYNSLFQDAVYRLAQISHDSNAPAVPVLFTWPSHGELLQYPYDRESTNVSRRALEEVLETLISDPAVTDITILAHSMGNWPLLESLRQRALLKGRIGKKVSTVLMAAADVDVDVFKTEIEHMGGDRPQFMLFVAEDDEALRASRSFWGGVPRIGAVDPSKEPYKTELERAKIIAINLTNLPSDGEFGHDKYALPVVARFIGQRLVSGQILHGESFNMDFQTGIGAVADNALATVGSAAALVVSAPTALASGIARRQ